MGKVIIGIVGLVIGLVVGGFFGGAIMGGTAAGVGIATGMSAGVCSTVIAAQEEGLLTPEQVDQVLTRAAADLAEMSGEAAPDAVVGSASDCEGVMDRIRSAAS
ncbi:hypothetical protein [Ovoidimarina sediminis]|uniref:hypothetical protein n=1 Tax=Ovoidimarina sediminis TaxID=3079856 RepID=UPI0029085302|nr:hypothetical protein [Rhodophyticola sp. MJ-SS7]MDU8946583.1 hypothetical protein [Rhodophyticola sp. MJ-SS7]